VLFARRHPDLRPSARAASVASARTLAATSTLVLVAQLGDLAIHYSSNLVIASHLGPAAVPRYSVAYALFMLAQTICTTLLGPLWPFYAEAAARGDRAWIVRRFRASLVRTVPVMLALSAGIVALGRPVIRIWAGEAAVPTHGLLAAMAVYFVLWMVSAVTWMLANGLGFFRMRALSSIASGGTFLLGSLALVGPLGLPAIPLAGSVAMGIDCALGAAALWAWRRGDGRRT
jgi:O-antigen/teichoic acid export membrane protein